MKAILFALLLVAVVAVASAQYLYGGYRSYGYPAAYGGYGYAAPAAYGYGAYGYGAGRYLYG